MGGHRWSESKTAFVRGGVAELYQKFTEFNRFAVSYFIVAQANGAQVNEPRDGFLIFHLAFPAGSFLKRNPALADEQLTKDDLIRPKMTCY